MLKTELLKYTDYLKHIQVIEENIKYYKENKFFLIGR